MVQSTFDTRMTSTPVDARETHSLIASDKVEGTAVYRSNGEKIGAIERVMIDKSSGKVPYAVMSFGGFLGMGADYYPVPWAMLKCDPRMDGYVVDIRAAAERRTALQHPRKLGLDEPRARTRHRRVLQRAFLLGHLTLTRRGRSTSLQIPRRRSAPSGAEFFEVQTGTASVATTPSCRHPPRSRFQ
jgi:sporulation protein YlmC with PRC-barrel domain